MVILINKVILILRERKRKETREYCGINSKGSPIRLTKIAGVIQQKGETNMKKENKAFDKAPKKVTRRSMIKGMAAAAGAVAAAVGFPWVKRSSAQSPIVLKMQSTWPTVDIFHEDFLDWVKKVEEMTGGRLKIDALPSGSVVPAFELITAVHRGVLARHYNTVRETDCHSF